MEILPPLASAGIAGALVIIIGYLLNANRQDRKEHRAERQEWDARLKAQRDEHDKQIADLRQRVTALEKEVRDETLRADRATQQLEALNGGSGR